MWLATKKCIAAIHANSLVNQSQHIQGTHIQEARVQLWQNADVDVQVNTKSDTSFEKCTNLTFQKKTISNEKCKYD